MTSEDGNTKVYYHLDDSTPYMSVVPVPYDHITLADFKKVFTRRGYNYFCKEYDQDLNKEVKVEISSDSQRLQKSGNGLIELFLLSQNGQSSSSLPQNNSGTLPRTASKNQSYVVSAPDFRLKKRRSSAHALSSIVDEMDVGGGQRVSMVTTNDFANERSISGEGEASSDINTLISKRAGEQLAELYTSSEDPYKYDVNSEPSFSSSNHYRRLLPSNCTEEDTSTLHNQTRQRRPRKQRYRKAYVPSTISSASESSFSVSLPRVDEIQLRLQDAPTLGISVACQDGGIFISSIKPGSAADICGQLEIGDQIVQIDHISFENLTDKQAVDVLKKVSMTKRTVKIYVAKRPRVSDQKSDALSLLCETMQLDVSLWVEATTKQGDAQPFTDVADQPPTTSSSSRPDNFSTNQVVNLNSLNGNHDGAVTSDEEKAAYADRRNGVGPRLVPALQSRRVHETLRHQDNQQNDNLLEPLNVSLDPIVVLKHMARPDSGLQIKNRKWLKIPVPMSFIGDEMIDWLLEHVSGFRDRKAARAYASVLLSNGYIKHVVNMNNFNEKCYYIFSDSIIAERVRLEQLASRSTLPLTGAMAGAESTTEVTYMSSPSSPFMTSNQMQKQTNSRQQSAGMVVKMASNPRYVAQPAIAPKLPVRNFNNNKGESSGKGLDPVAGPSTTNTTWPISPITVFNQNQSMLAAFCSRRDCESPAVTNDYASMIQGEINKGAQFDPSEAPTLKLKENKPPLPNTNTIIPPAPQRSAPIPNLF